MYPVSSSVILAIAENALMKLSMTIEPIAGPVKLFATDSNVVMGGFTLDRRSVSGSSLEIGSAISSDLTIKFDASVPVTDESGNNYYLNDLVLEGAVIRPSVKVGDTTIPLGVFTVDTPPRKLSTVTISALDRMMRFDRKISFTEDSISLPELLSYACEVCSVPLNAEKMPEFPMIGETAYMVTGLTKLSPDEVTYRTIIQWIGEITGTCAYMDETGSLCFSWYEQAKTTDGQDIQITPANRMSSDIFDTDIQFTGVDISVEQTISNEYGEDTQTVVYSAPAADNGFYKIAIEGNQLITHDGDLIASFLWEKIKNTRYRPSSASTFSCPYLSPMDIVKFVDSSGVAHDMYITQTTHYLNKNSTVYSSGETAQNKSYATASPLTRAEQVIIDQAKNDGLQTGNNALTAANDFANMMANAMGLYVTVRVEENGSLTRYFHDEAELESSQVIFRFNAGGISVSTTGINGSFANGISAAGNAFFNRVYAKYIMVSSPGASSGEDEGDTYGGRSIVLDASKEGVPPSITIRNSVDSADPETKISTTGSYLRDLRVKEILQIGDKIGAVPSYEGSVSDGVQNGANIIFLG